MASASGKIILLVAGYLYVLLMRRVSYVSMFSEYSLWFILARTVAEAGWRYLLGDPTTTRGGSQQNLPSHLVSFVHAASVTVLRARVFRGDLHAVIVFSAAYFVTDLGYMLRGHTPTCKQTLIHHVVSLGLCGVGLLVPTVLHGMILRLYDAELSTLFIAASWVSYAVGAVVISDLLFIAFAVAFAIYRVYGIAVQILLLAHLGLFAPALCILPIYAMQVFWAAKIGRVLCALGKQYLFT